MATQYDMLIRASSKDLPTILQVIEKTATLINISVVKEEAAPVEHKRKHFEYSAGKRDKGITAKDLVIKVLSSANRVFDNMEIIKVFLEHNFSANSHSPALSALIKDDKVRNVAKGKYELVR